MSKLQEVKEAIKYNFPDFKLRNIKSFVSGCDNDTYLLNRKYILRYPKHNKAINHIESCLLPKLENYITAKIPEVIHSGNYKNKSFMIYKPVDGIKLNEKILKDMPEKERDQLFNQIIIFLEELHSFSIIEAKKCGVKFVNFKLHFRKLLKKSKNILNKRLRKKEINRLETRFDEYLNNKDNFAYKPSLLHADLSISYIFADKNYKLSGIIDFGDTGIGDPDYDLIYLKDFRDSFNNYLKNRKDARNLEYKIKFFLLTCDINGIIYGIKTKNKYKINKEINDLRKRLENW